MGTSNLYKGPKKNILLPSDYNPDEIPELDNSPENVPEQELPSDKPEENEPSESPIQPVTWGTVRSSFSKAMNNRNGRNVKSAVRNYTKALGGHTNATRQAVKVRNAAGVIYSYFAGTPDEIRKRLEEVGIQFNDRPTKNIFRDICNFITPVPNDLEDSLVNIALQETFADVAADPNIDLSRLDSFNEELLQRLIGGLMKHYIFPLKIARPPTVFVRALGESPALGHAARAAVFERRVRQILKFPLRACCLKRAS